MFRTSAAFATMAGFLALAGSAKATNTTCKGGLLYAFEIPTNDFFKFVPDEVRNLPPEPHLSSVNVPPPAPHTHTHHHHTHTCTPLPRRAVDSSRVGNLCWWFLSIVANVACMHACDGPR